MQKLNVEKLVSVGCIPPQIYTYPPRKVLINQGGFDNINSLWNNSALPNELGLYFHFPFWKYKCVYCNLYAFECEDESLIEMYVETLCQQLMEHLEVLKCKKITTLHFGGGDPLLLGFQCLKKIIELLDSILPGWNEEVLEFSVESTPYSVIKAEKNDDITKLMQLGVNRINISAAPYIYNNVGIVQRVYEETLVYDAINILKHHSINNVSIDLILGIDIESITDWINSINKICKLQPNTITFLPLTVRRDSKYGQDKDISLLTTNNYYNWYDAGKEILHGFGYKQQTSTRFVIEDGGNLQEDKHFSLGSILGIGAGARSYNVVADYFINPEYSGVESIRKYILLMREHKLMEIVYFSDVFSKVELLRKRLVLDYSGISKEDVLKINNDTESKKILQFFQNLIKCNYYYIEDDTCYFTELGMKYHDLICLAYYSDCSKESDPDLWQSIM